MDYRWRCEAVQPNVPGSPVLPETHWYRSALPPVESDEYIRVCTTLAEVMSENLRSDQHMIASLKWSLDDAEYNVDMLNAMLDRERIAAIQHEIWAHWMEYQFSVCIKNDDGSLTIPAGKVERWERQIATPYSELSEQERNSDRDQADKIRKTPHTLENTKEITMDDKTFNEEIEVLAALDELLRILTKNKPNDRSSRDRAYAVAITDSGVWPYCTDQSTP